MLPNTAGNDLNKWLVYEWLTLKVIINLAADRPVKDWADDDAWDGLARDLVLIGGIAVIIGLRYLAEMFGVNWIGD